VSELSDDDEVVVVLDVPPGDDEVTVPEVDVAVVVSLLTDRTARRGITRVF
jgi:hypothetical protein